MTDTPNPFEQMMRQMQDMAKANPAMNAFSTKGFEAMMGTMPKDMMEMMFGNKMNPDGLDAKTRMLLTIAGLTMQGAQNDLALKQAVRHAIEAGAHNQHVIETIGQMALFAGLPAMTRAMEIAQSVLSDDKDADKEGDA